MHSPQWNERERRWRADVAAVSGRRDCSVVRVLWLLATRPGLVAIALLRLQQRAHRVLPPLAWVLRSVNHVLTGADFVPGVRVGPGLRLEHPNGVVLGAGAVVGRNGFLCQRVTLGERLGEVDGAARAPGYPVLGDDVFVGAGATILGAVHVGSGARIGAGAVVVRDVPAGAVAVGNPARIVRRDGHERVAVNTVL